MNPKIKYETIFGLSENQKPVVILQSLMNAVCCNIIIISNKFNKNSKQSTEHS